MAAVKSLHRFTVPNLHPRREAGCQTRAAVQGYLFIDRFVQAVFPKGCNIYRIMPLLSCISNCYFQILTTCTPGLHPKLCWAKVSFLCSTEMTGEWCVCVISNRRLFFSTHSWWKPWSFSNTAESPECHTLLTESSGKVQSWSKGWTTTPIQQTAPVQQAEASLLADFVEGASYWYSFSFKLCQGSRACASGKNRRKHMWHIRQLWKVTLSYGQLLNY